HGGQVVGVQGYRAEVSRQPAHGPGGTSEHGAHPDDEVAGLRIPFTSSGQAVEVEIEGHQRLPDVVVKRVGQSGALCLVLVDTPQGEATKIRPSRAVMDYMGGSAPPDIGHRHCSPP